jgi:hypothetical protein
MVLKNDFANGDQLTAIQFNEVTTAVNAAYVKPGSGIPSTDLASAVQTSLGKADSAVQSVSSTSITDATTTGKALLTTTDASTARTTLGVAYGSTSGTVAQGNDSRFSPASTAISDSTATGRALLTATDASTARTTLGVAYGTTAGTVAQGNDSRFGTVTGTVAVANGGSGATSLSGVLKGNGTSAFTAATAGTDYVAPSGALGTPSSGTLTNCTSLPVSGITASTSTALGVGTVELGHATDTTVSRSAAGVIAVEGVTVPLNSITNTHTAQQIELGHATDTTLTRSAAGVLAVEGVTVPLNSTTNIHTAQQIELGHVSDTTITRSSAGVLAVEGVVIPSISSAVTLTNKTINGASNTLSNIPASATPNASRLVVTTAAGAAGTEDGANTWAKIATISFGTNQFYETQVVLSVVGQSSGLHDSAIISVFARSQATSSNPLVDIQMIAKAGGENLIMMDSFKVISGAWSTDIEVWMRKRLTYGVFNVYEISRGAASVGSNAIIYNDGAAWQSATPTGAVNNVSTNGVTAFAVPVVTTTATQTLTNKRITPRINTVTSSATPAINVDTTDQFNITAQAAAITSMTSGLTGTPTDGQPLTVRIKDNGTARAITWGASFSTTGLGTPITTTVVNKTHIVQFIYDSTAAKWACIRSDSTGY